MNEQKSSVKEWFQTHIVSVQWLIKKRLIDPFESLRYNGKRETMVIIRRRYYTQHGLPASCLRLFRSEKSETLGLRGSRKASSNVAQKGRLKCATSNHRLTNFLLRKARKKLQVTRYVVCNKFVKWFVE